MAALVDFCWFSSSLLSLSLLFTVSNTSENKTEHSLNITLFGDQNATYNDTDSYSTTPPTGFDSSTPKPADSSTEEPTKPTVSVEPLPVSGVLPAPVVNIGRLCPCDEHQDMCDINCCCDRECREEVALFTSCSVPTVSDSKQLCSWDIASYSLVSTIDGYTKLQPSLQKETNYDVFCIQSQNRVDGVSHPSPALPTGSNFDSLFNQFTGFIFSAEQKSGLESIADVQASSGYQYGDVIVTAGEVGQRALLWLPAPSFTSDCMDTNPAAFLKDQSSRCSRRVVLELDCSTMPALNMNTYASIQLFTGKNKDAAVVPVEVASVILQSVNGTQTELQISGGENLNPFLLNPTLCANVVLKVSFVIMYNPAGEIANVTLSVVLGFVREDALPLQQEFHIKFVQEEVTVHYSGNPGYVVGLPLVAGTRTAEGIARSIDPRDTLSLLRSTEDQVCLQGQHQRSPVLFDVDYVSGCTLRLEDVDNCSLVSQTLLNILRGAKYPQYVASFGNSPLDSTLDWVPIQSNFNLGEGQGCSIPVSLHLEIEWTKYGSLVNPHAQIVSIKEVIQTNITSLKLLSGGSSILLIQSSVAFKAISAAAAAGYRAMPTINAKLASDFFFPFV